MQIITCCSFIAGVGRHVHALHNGVISRNYSSVRFTEKSTHTNAFLFKQLRVIVSKNQRNRGHGQKIDFAHTLSV